MTPIWWLLALIPALVLLYFLKLKRRDVIVSSTFLWKRSVEDLRVNSPFQRLRKSLLFLLQLLVLCLLILAIWRPRCDRIETGGRNLLVLIDRSASMTATEASGTRLDLAKEKALSLVRSLGPDDRMSLSTFADTIESLQPLTSDHALLESRIQAIRPSGLPTRLSDTLRAVYALAETLAEVEVHVLGDGAYSDLGELPDEISRLDLRFTNTATRRDNFAITEADVERPLGGKRGLEVYALVESFSREPGTLTVSLLRDDVLLRASVIELAPGGSRVVTFDVGGVEPGSVRLEIDADDALAVDNVAYLEILPQRTVYAWLVGPRSFLLESAFGAIPSVELRRLSLAELDAALAVARDRLLAGEPESEALPSVIVFDRGAPIEPTAFPALYFACVPRLREGVPPPVEEAPSFAIDADLSHPVNYLLEIGELAAKKSLVFEPSAEMLPLVESEGGAMIVATTLLHEGRVPVPALLVGFDLFESNWPINNPSFPIFFVNAIDWLARGMTSDGGRRRRTGEQLALSRGAKGDAAELVLEAPGGERSPGIVEIGGTVRFARATRPGFYRVLRGGEEVERFAVSLLDPDESRLEPRETFDLGDVAVRAKTDLRETSGEIWTWLALAGLALLLLEWYVYNRRAFV